MSAPVAVLLLVMMLALVLLGAMLCLWLTGLEVRDVWEQRRRYRQIGKIRRMTMDQMDQVQEEAWQRRLHESQGQIRRFAKEHDL